MKHTKVSSWQLILCVTLIIAIMAGCDAFEDDPDIGKTTVELNNGDVYALATQGAIFYPYVSALGVSGFRMEITQQPAHGTLIPLRQGQMFHYQPGNKSFAGRDNFELTIYDIDNGNILKRDTVYVNIETDSTKLPCSVYAGPDYVYNVRRGQTITIDAAANDYSCDGKPVQISIYSGDTSDRGQVTVVGNKIVYVANDSFTTADTIIYTAGPDSPIPHYGVIYLSSDGGCKTAFRADAFQLDSMQIGTTASLPVFANDTLCLNNIYQYSIKTHPFHGTVSIDSYGVQYKRTSLSVSDSFEYQACTGTTCMSAKVTVSFTSGAVSGCRFQAVTDTLNIAGNSNPLIYLNVLQNDQLCDSLSTLGIVEAPRHGSASVRSSDSVIVYQRAQNLNDSLSYTICSASRCSTAKVYIKQE